MEPIDGVEPGGEVTGLPEPDLVFSYGTLPGSTTSGKKLSSSMNKDSNLLDLTGWQPPEFFAPWIPFKNPVHPPPSTVPTSEKPWTILSSYQPVYFYIWFPGSSFPAHVTAQ
ncbi:hypothetical protein CHARACLAT_030047 [Characodon lateralis]|uniref:Uncharacterized protein n=1 Tax=Characodon lateralis TaxID=208331 RepID=A0ABU7F0H7_9TELE|nr:hypothetical protein [Characodon lateralis]